MSTSGKDDNKAFENANIETNSTKECNNNSEGESNCSDATSKKSSGEYSEHRFIRNSRYFTILVYSLLFVLGAILIYKFVGNFGVTLDITGKLISILSPFIGGLFIAFVLYPLVKYLYRKVFTGYLKLKPGRLAKALSILFAYLIAIGIIVILIVFIVPQIYESLRDITNQLPVWYNSAVNFLNGFQENHPDWTFIDYDIINNTLQSALPKITDHLSKWMTSAIPAIFNTSMAIVKGFINCIIAIIVSVYMISDHKNLFYQFKRLLYAIMPEHAADVTKKVVRESGRIFTSFILGKAVDSLIIGLICFACTLIFKFPYAVLISVIVGITNMIPYFGPYIGGIIGGIIIIIVNPIQVIFWAILILVIQQFDGLYLGPKILGDKTGLKPLWVIFSITVGGSLFGVLGMFLGVPCVAVLSYILNLAVEHFLNKKKIKIQPDESPHKI